MNSSGKAGKYEFLQGGGELGALTRSFNWAGTSAGSPDTWPMHLRLTVAMMLRSKFPMFLWWGDELIQFYNDAYRPSLGNNGKHPLALGQKGKDCWPEIWDIISPLINQVRTTGEATWSKDQLVPIYRNGKIEDVYWTFGYSAITDEQGRTDGVLVICTETTETVNAHKRTEEAKKAAEWQKRLYETITDSTPDLIYVFDLNYRFTYANAALLTMWGKTWDTAIGKGLLENGYEPWHAEMHEREIDQVVATKAAVRGEVAFPHAVLGKRIYDYILVPVFSENGEVEAVAGTTRDITELTRAHQAIRESEERFRKSERNLRSIILQSPVAMCILLGPDHTVDIANEAIIRLWGKPEADVMNKPIFEGLPDAREQGLEQLLDDVYRTGKSYTASERPVMLFRNGKTDKVYQNFVYEPYHDADGTILGVLAITVDVTEQVLARHKIEEIVNARTGELATANQQLQRSNDELAQFAYIASHDLQEPLRKVINYAQMLDMSLGSISEKPKHYLQKIQDSTSRMAVLIRDVLSYSQLSKERVLFEPVDLQAVIDSIQTDFELLIEQKNAQIRCTQLPVIEANLLQMTQLFGNLLSNALKFTRADEDAVIDIAAKSLSAQEVKEIPTLSEGVAYYAITVKDNGIGFDQGYADQIFHIFQRLHGKTQYSGTGIGLAMCKKIARNHNGEIFASSTPGQGASFTIVLPRLSAPFNLPVSPL